MQFKNLIISLLISSVVAKGSKNGTSTKAVTDKSLCKEMASLEKTVNLAASKLRSPQSE